MSTEKYQKLSHREHILIRPESYVGSIVKENKEIFIVNELEDFSNLKFEKKNVEYNPAFIKIIDEILVNASDHYIRTNGEVKKIKINVENEKITVENDGPGIPIEKSKKHNIYIPEMIFGHLLTGENYNDNETRMVGGRNGYGAKITNIYSKRFDIECVDGISKYKQSFYNNLTRKSTPKITKAKRPYTKISFIPDFERFDIENITEDIKKIILKRAIDISVYCPKVKVYFNDKLIPVKNFKEYINMYIEDNSEIFYEKLDENWEIGVIKSTDDQFEQVSMVNGIFTYEGGTHVTFISNQITKKISEALEKKHKGSKIRDTDIERNLFVFVNCKISNPSFSSQTKEKLITKLTKEHKRDVEISQNFVKKILNSEIIDSIIRYIEAKEAAKLKNQGGKKYRVNIKKLDDANKAGSVNSNECSLFLTEGDSASSMVLSGIEKKDKDYYGLFPLRGKVLNVRDVSMNKITENEEIKNIINILGLKFGEKYTDTSKLRYGKLVFLTDSDVDGHHIKGLLINLIDYFWPELLNLDFIYEFVTPIVRATKGKSKKYFYKLKDYRKFKDSEESKGYFFKYYKGLGTIDPSEAKNFFKKLNKHLIKIENSENKDIIDMVFKKKRTEERKNWLYNYKPDENLDKFSQKTTIDSFFNKEFVEYSMYDNVRSIPSVIDGFKPAQRKILYTLFKKNYQNEIKVSQLSGAIIELSAYHHAPASLEESIVGMAQDFVGSNNVNFLEPLGQFGTRVHGGSDSSASRYISTKLKPYTKYIFKKEDNEILKYLNDDGKDIEPEYFVPIIPTLLINGSKGVGTGYSTDIPKYYYRDIINWYKAKLTDKKPKNIKPYFKDFKGDIIWDKKNNKYITRGKYEIINSNQIKITELPLNLWNVKFIDHLEKLVNEKKIKEYQNNCTDTEIDFVIKLNDEPKKDYIQLFKLETYFRFSNMYAFNPEGKLKKYENVNEILEEFYNVRYYTYEKRKQNMIDKIEYEKNIISNKALFIQYVLSKKIILNNAKKSDVEKSLEKLEFDKINDSYDYLFNMNMLSLTYEKLEELKNRFINIKKDLLDLKNKSIKDLWLEDLGNIKIK